MSPFLFGLFTWLGTFFRSRYNLSLEIIALRQQLGSWLAYLREDLREYGRNFLPPSRLELGPSFRVGGGKRSTLPRGVLVAYGERKLRFFTALCRSMPV
jgi:hypothetical protein